MRLFVAQINTFSLARVPLIRCTATPNLTSGKQSVTIWIHFGSGMSFLCSDAFNGTRPICGSGTACRFSWIHSPPKILYQTGGILIGRIPKMHHYSRMITAALTAAVASSLMIVSAGAVDANSNSTSKSAPVSATSSAVIAKTVSTASDDEAATESTEKTYPETLYATDWLNVRSGPGTTYDVIDTVEKDYAFTVTGEAENGWYPITYEDQTAYISADWVTETEPPHTMYSTDYLNLRTEPNTDCDILKTVSPDTALSISGEANDGWYTVIYSDEVTCYVSADWVTDEVPATLTEDTSYASDSNDYSYDNSGSGTASGSYLGVYTLTAYEWTGNACANGNYPTEGYTVACNSLPLGTQIYIEGYGTFTVEDRGGMGSNVIDIYLGDVSACYDFGVRSAAVYIVG